MNDKLKNAIGVIRDHCWEQLNCSDECELYEWCMKTLSDEPSHWDDPREDHQ